MPSLKAIFGDTVGRWVFSEATVLAVRELGPHFRKLELDAPDVRATGWAPGDKAQVLISREGLRTYTPFQVDLQRGRMAFLAFVHGHGVAARWVGAVKPGDTFRYFGPRSSLKLGSVEGPVTLFGDETSFAVARALVEGRGATGGLQFVFEVSSPSQAEEVTRALELPQVAFVEKRNDDGHLLEVEARLRGALSAQTTLVLTGKAQSIQQLRSHFKHRAVAHAGQLVKAYWSVGQKGLD